MQPQRFTTICRHTQHNRLDSALIQAKIKGVDEIYQRESGSYADYVCKAQLSCVLIKQTGNMFYVNASVRVPKTTFVVDEKVLKKNLRKLYKESKKRAIRKPQVSR